MTRATALALVLAIASTLLLCTGCGGHSEEPPPEDPPSTQPVDCRATPELCR